MITNITSSFAAALCDLLEAEENHDTIRRYPGSCEYVATKAGELPPYLCPAAQRVRRMAQAVQAERSYDS